MARSVVDARIDGRHSGTAGTGHLNARVDSGVYQNYYQAAATLSGVNYTLAIFKTVAGTQTQLGAVTKARATYGDYFRFQVQGTSLKLFESLDEISWTEQISVTDSSVSTGDWYCDPLITETAFADLIVPTITTHPSDAANKLVNDSITFTAGATNAVSAKWQVNTGGGWSDIPGATNFDGGNSTYSKVVATGEGGYQYRCIFSGGVSEAATNAAVLTIAVYLGNLVDSGFENGADGTTLSNPPWVPNGTGQHLEYDNIRAKVGTMSAWLQGPAAAGSSGIEESVSAGMTADGSSLGFWLYFDTNTEVRYLYDIGTTAQAFTIRFGGDGTIATYVNTGKSVTGYTPAPGYFTIGNYTTGWSQFRIVFNFTNDTFAFYTRSDANSAWTALKSAGAIDYNIPMRTTDNVVQSQNLRITCNQNANLWVDDVRYGLDLFRELVGPLITSNPTAQWLPVGSVATFSASASSAIAAQWEVNAGSGWSEMPGETNFNAGSSILDFTISSNQNAYQYRCKFSSADGSVYTAPATLYLQTSSGITVTTNSDLYGMHGYAAGLRVAGGHVFVCYMDVDHHFHVSRFDETTHNLDGDIDLGLSPNPVEPHVHPGLDIDPTDNCIVVISSGYAGPSPNDTLTRICKTTHAYGGTDVEWAANDFGSWANFPFPTTGVVAYNPHIFTDNGTLVVIGSNRTSQSNGDPALERNFMVYRYVGDGTSKTAAQLASGSWVDLVGQATDFPDVPAGSEWIAGTMYPACVKRKGTTGVAIVFASYRARATWTNSADRYGTGYLYCDDITAGSPIWKKADGTAWTPGTHWNATQRSDSVLTIHDGSADYYADIMWVGGMPHVVYNRLTLNGTFNGYTDMTVHESVWNGSAWVHTRIDRGVQAQGGNPKAMITNSGERVVISHDGSIYITRNGVWVKTSGPARGVTQGQSAFIVPASQTDAVINWVERTSLTPTYGIRWAPLNLSFTVDVINQSVVLGWTGSVSIYRSSQEGVTDQDTLVHSGSEGTFTDHPGPGTWYYQAMYSNAESVEYSNTVLAVINSIFFGMSY